MSSLPFLDSFCTSSASLRSRGIRSAKHVARQTKSQQANHIPDMSRFVSGGAYCSPRVGHILPNCPAAPKLPGFFVRSSRKITEFCAPMLLKLSACIIPNRQPKSWLIGSALSPPNPKARIR
jgi:hypothetical protein